MQINQKENVNFVDVTDTLIETGVKIETPFYSAHLDKPAFFGVLLDKDFDMTHTNGVTIDLPSLSETQAQKNVLGSGIEKILKEKTVLVDPRSEVIYFGLEESRDGIRKINNLPTLRNILRDANTKNHDAVWCQNLGNAPDLTKFVEFCIQVQNGLSTVPLPITPFINRRSSFQIIDLAFQINRESHGLAIRSFGNKTAGFYLNLDCDIFEYSSDRIAHITKGLEDSIKNLDDLLLYIRFHGSEKLSYDGLRRVMMFLNHLYRKRHENDNKRMLVMTSGLNTYGILAINNGAEGFDEVISGKNTLGQGGFSRTRKKKEPYFNFSKYYNPTDMEEDAYLEIRKFVQERGVLPCTEQICNRTAPNFLQLNYRRYAEFNRKHRIESRNREIREIKKDVNEGNMRGLEDKFGRSKHRKVQRLAELVA